MSTTKHNTEPCGHKCKCPETPNPLGIPLEPCREQHNTLPDIVQRSYKTFETFSGPVETISSDAPNIQELPKDSCMPMVPVEDKKEPVGTLKTKDEPMGSLKIKKTQKGSKRKEIALVTAKLKAVVEELYGLELLESANTDLLSGDTCTRSVHKQVLLRHALELTSTFLPTVSEMVVPEDTIKGIQQLFGLELLEFHDKNTLSGTDESRIETKLKLLKSLLD